jgi:hypothetical protein
MNPSSTHKSSLVPSVRFESAVESEAVLPYVREKARRLLQVQEDISNFDQVRRVPQEKVITEMDWAQRGDAKRVLFDYVYREVMSSARKRDGKVLQAAYAPTFDRALTPERCEITDVHYGTMTLGGTPIMYYIRYDLGTLIEKAREQEGPGELSM